MASHGSERHDPPTHPSRGEGSGARLPEHVYRRRRLVALGVLILLVLALVGAVVMGARAVMGSGGQDEDPAAAPEPTVSTQVSANPDQKFADFTPRPSPSGSRASAGASGTQSPSSTATAECGANLSVAASTDKESYAAKENPVLVMTLENTGDQPCTVAAGSTKMAFVVTSGADTVFDSRHCAAATEDKTVTLNAGQKETAKLTWNRTRTAEGCPADQAQALAGYYNLTVSLGDTSSKQHAFVLQ